MSVIQSIISTCQKMGDVELSGVKLESAERDLLNVGWGDLNKHVAMQPAAMAYFGSLKKESKRNLDRVKKDYDRWEKKKYAEAKVAVQSGTTAVSSIKVEDVKARLIIDNDDEMQKWNGRIDKAQMEYDTLDVWLEAWKQKSFSLSEYISIDGDERFMGKTSVTEQDIKKKGESRRSQGADTSPRTTDTGKADRVRAMLRDKRVNKGIK